MPVSSWTDNQLLTRYCSRSSATAFTVCREGSVNRLPAGDVRRHPCLSQQIFRDTGNLREIDFVDLLRVEELLRVAQINLLPNEYVEQVRIDVAIELELAQNGQRFGERLALLVWTILCGQCFEDIGDAHHTCLHRHL